MVPRIRLVEGGHGEFGIVLPLQLLLLLLGWTGGIYGRHQEYPLLHLFQRAGHHIGGVGYGPPQEWRRRLDFQRLPLRDGHDILGGYELPYPGHLPSVDIEQFLSLGMIGLGLLQQLLDRLPGVDVFGQLLHLGVRLIKQSPACLQELLGAVIEHVILAEQLLEQFLPNGEVTVGLRRHPLLQKCGVILQGLRRLLARLVQLWRQFRRLLGQGGNEHGEESQALLGGLQRHLIPHRRDIFWLDVLFSLCQDLRYRPQPAQDLLQSFLQWRELLDQQQEHSAHPLIAVCAGVTQMLL